MTLGQSLVLCYGIVQGLIALLIAVFASKAIYQNVSIADLTAKSALKLWFKLFWKMRSIYTSLIVHIFDFITDILVICEWFESSKNESHVDKTVMAYSSLFVLFFHKFVSSLAIYDWTGHDRKQAIMQFFDLLLFVDIYETHKRLVESVIDIGVFVLKPVSGGPTATTPDPNSHSAGQSVINNLGVCKDISAKLSSMLGVC